MSAINDQPITHRDRIEAALRGEVLDRTPISLWLHFPREDETAAGLAAATTRFYQQYDIDLIKLMPTGMYPVIDYGVQVSLNDDPGGSTHFVSGPIQQPADLRRLAEVSPERGVLRREIDAVRLVREALGPDLPVIETIFSPLNVAVKLFGNQDLLLEAVETNESAVAAALERITDDVVAFGQAALAAGADGFFYATVLADRANFPEEINRRLGVPYDLRVLEALRPGSRFIVLHLHGDDPAFDLADALPVDAVNWHDREADLKLAQALEQTSRVLVGGIQRGGVIAKGTPEEAAAEVRDAIAQTGGRRLIVAPGCAIPITAPAANLRAARDAVNPV